MRHQVKKKKLNRNATLRRATVNNLLTSLFLHGAIRTTIAKGKVAASSAEKLLNSLRAEPEFNQIRKLNQVITSEVASRRILQEWLPKFQGTASGFVKTVHLGPRQSDAAEMVQISLA